MDTIGILLTVINVLMVCVGLVLLGLSGWLGIQSVARLTRWCRSERTVVKFSRVEGCSCPVVEFALADGTTVTFTASSGRGTRQFKEGDSVPILYNPRDPQEADLRTCFAMWFFPVALGLLGLVFVVGSGLKLLGIW